MRDKLRQLLDRRASLWEDVMKPIVEQDERSAEDMEKYRAAEVELDEVTAEIELVSGALEREASEREAREKRAEMLSFLDDQAVTADEVHERDITYNDVFNTYLREGAGALDWEQRKVLVENRQEFRALAAGTDSAGGYTVPEGFFNSIVDSRQAFGGIRNAPVTVLTTASGNDIPVPTGDDTGNTGELLAENNQAATADPSFGQVTLQAFMWSSKIVRVSFQLLQDSAFDLDAWLADKLGMRIGRAQASYFITGTGSSEPEGIMTGITTGHTTTSGQTTTFIWDDFVELEHSVDAAYRSQGHYLLSDDALKAVRLVKDDQSRPLWAPGMAIGDVSPTINGYGYTVDQNMAAVAATNKPVVFGDVSHYFIRDVTGAALLRLEERYADYLQVGFLAFMRTDARNVDPGDDPYKALVMAAS